jgi:ammonia channel protein AmtB
VAILWGLVAYSMIYGSGSSRGVIGDDSYATVNKMGDFGFVFYSYVYAMTAMAIITGGVGGTMHKYPFLLFVRQPH